MTVAVLYVDPLGSYPKLRTADIEPAFIDCWDVARDARNYDGPHPVVAHPPCRHWSALAHQAKVSCSSCGWSGMRCRLTDDDAAGGSCPSCKSGWNVRFDDRDCGPRAVEQVRKWGGVLEHPAGSKLWEHYAHRTDGMCLPYPETHPDWDVPTGDNCSGYTIEVDQVEWGHVARKRTWLYLVGVPRSALEAPPFPGREPTHYCGGGRTPSSRTGGAIPAGMKAASSQQKRRTPPLFAEYLIRLARSVKR